MEWIEGGKTLDKGFGLIRNRVELWNSSLRSAFCWEKVMVLSARKRRGATEENLKTAVQIESSQPVFRLCMHVEVACRRMNKFYSVKR